MVLNSDTRLSAILNDVRGYFNPDSNRKKRCIVSYDRFQSFFEETFSKWVVHNQTDFNYEYCNTYYVNKPCSKKNPTQPEIQVYISYVSDVYDFIVGIRRLQNNRFVPVCETDFIHRYGSHTQTISDYFEQQGFVRMKEEWYDIVIPNLQTQLNRQPTLANCLFQDRG